MKVIEWLRSFVDGLIDRWVWYWEERDMKKLERDYPLYENTLYVSDEKGCDETAEINNEDRPYKTVQAALEATKDKEGVMVKVVDGAHVIVGAMLPEMIVCHITGESCPTPGQCDSCTITKEDV